MKTAEEIATDIFQDCENLIIDHQRIQDIKEYGKQCAQQALNDAAENAKMTFHCGHTKRNIPTKHHQSGSDNLQVDKESILRTKILTP